MSILANLPLEILLSIVDLLSAEDFVKFSRSSKEFHDNRLLKKYAWLGYFGRKWELSDNEAKKMKNLSSNLYPLCHPLGSAVFSNMNVGLKCSKNIALFLGLVGAGNQSVQAKTPFPILSKLESEMTWVDIFEQFMTTAIGNIQLMAPLYYYATCQVNKNTYMIQTPISNKKLFSTPFKSISHGNSSSYVLPRFIAYYEVLITKRERSTLNTLTTSTTANEWRVNNHDQNNQNYDNSQNSNFSQFSECIAVGLATKDFELDKKMVGWDIDSYGYHSDDGAIFHGRGRQLSTYGPSFGVGDTVGCGIDYESRSIFFTLNGTYQGTAFSGVDLAEGQELYPTVGIDAAVEITFNFGRENFEFDLQGYINKREIEAAFLQELAEGGYQKPMSRMFI